LLLLPFDLLIALGHPAQYLVQRRGIIRVRTIADWMLLIGRLL